MASGVDAASQPVQRRVGLWGLTPGDPPGTVLVHAPAKLNLTLSVLARRPDRFHERADQRLFLARCALPQ